MKNVKMIFQFLLAFFLTVCILITVLWATVFSEKAILSALEHSQYYEASVDAFNNELIEEARPSGFPLTLFENYVSIEEGKNLMTQHATALLRGEEYEYPLDEFRETLKIHLYDYMEAQGIKPTLAIQQGVKDFVYETGRVYRRFLRVPFLDNAVVLVQLYQQVFPIVVGAGLVVILMLVGLLYKMNTRNKRFLQDVLISTMAAGWMMVMLPTILLVTNTFGRISIEPLYFSRFVILLIHTSLGWMILSGALLLLCSTLLGIHNGNRMGLKKRIAVSKEEKEETQFAS